MKIIPQLGSQACRRHCRMWMGHVAGLMRSYDNGGTSYCFLWFFITPETFRKFLGACEYLVVFPFSCPTRSGLDAFAIVATRHGLVTDGKTRLLGVGQQETTRSTFREDATPILDAIRLVHTPFPGSGWNHRIIGEFMRHSIIRRSLEFCDKTFYSRVNVDTSRFQFIIRGASHADPPTGFRISHFYIHPICVFQYT